MQDETATGVRAAVAAYVLWGLLTIYWKQLADFDPFELIGWRIICATVVMAVDRHRSAGAGACSPRRSATAASVLRLRVAALLLTANWTGYVWAVANDRVIETALGYFMAPLGTMLLGVTVLDEHADPAAQAGPGPRRAGRRRAHDLLRPRRRSSP